MYLSDRTGFDIILITDSRGGTPSKKTISKGTETMKKLLSLILALVMVLSVASIAGAEELTELNTYETQARELETWNIH